MEHSIRSAANRVKNSGEMMEIQIKTPSPLQDAGCSQWLCGCSTDEGIEQDRMTVSFDRGIYPMNLVIPSPALIIKIKGPTIQ